MAPLVHLLIALMAIGVAEAGAQPSVRWPVAVMTFAVVPGLLRRAALHLGTRGRFRLAAVAARGIELWPPLASAFAIIELGWHAEVLRWTGAPAVLLDWPHPALLLSLFPLALYEVASVRARALLADRRPSEVAQRVRFQLRQLSAASFPILFFVGLGSLVAASTTLRVALEEVALFGALGTIASVLALGSILPFLLTRTWNTASLSTPRSRQEYPWQSPLLARIAEESGLRYRDLRVWRTGHLVANAAVVGFAPFHRFVLFSDLLLAQLGPRELVAVFGHEVGHARRHHVGVFASWALGFMLVTDWALQRLGPDSEVVALSAFALALSGAAIGFGYLARRIELDADLAAFELTGDAEGLARALELVGGAHPKRDTWRHFSIAKRIAFLARAATDRSVGRRLRARLRAWTLAGATLFLAGAGLQTWSLVHDLPGDLTRRDLRLGHYAEAAARAAASGRVDPLLRAIAERAAADPAGDGAGAEVWGQRAETALKARNWEASKEYLFLAALRGSETHEAILDALLGETPKRLEAPWNALVESEGSTGTP